MSNVIIATACSSCLGLSKTNVKSLCELCYSEWFAEKSCGENW